MHLIPRISLADMIMIIFIINNFLCKYDHNLILSSTSIIVNKFDNIFNTKETYVSNLGKNIIPRPFCHRASSIHSWETKTFNSMMRKTFITNSTIQFYFSIMKMFSTYFPMHTITVEVASFFLKQTKLSC